jgi:hypothetical protein
MKKLLFFVCLSIPFCAIGQAGKYLEFKAGPNFTSVLDDYSTADYGYDFSLGFTSPSKNGRFSWNLALLQSKSSAVIRYGNELGTIANPSIPGSDDVSYYDIKKSAYFLSIPFSTRYYLKNGKHGFYFENSAGPALLVAGSRKETYHYETNPDYVLEYNRFHKIMNFRMMVGAAFGWEMKLKNNVKFSVSPNISCLFMDLSPLSQTDYYYNATVLLGVKSGLAFGY